jgi:glycosyltransferase involved in cell wall biosynthesis
LSDLPVIGERLRKCFLFVDKLLTAGKIGRTARELHKEYKFCLVHGHETYVGDEAAPVARMLGVPSVFTLHSLYSYHVQSFGEAVVRRAVANMNATDGLIAVSRLSAESYRERGVRRDFHIILNGAELEPSGSSHSKAPKELVEFTRGKFVLLTVGFLVPEKRIEQSIMTLARLHGNGMRHTVLLIIGKGRLEPQLRGFIEREGLINAAKLVGEVAPRDMPFYYAVADVLVHPSIVDSCPMACLEAMSYGKPIICTSNIGLAEYLHPGTDAVVVPPDDSEALYQAVLTMIQDPSRRHMLGEQAYRMAANLSWDNQVRKIERVYEEVLSK